MGKSSVIHSVHKNVLSAYSMPLTVSDTDAYVGEYDNYQPEISWRANVLIPFFFSKWQLPHLLLILIHQGAWG